MEKRVCAILMILSSLNLWSSDKSLFERCMERVSGPGSTFVLGCAGAAVGAYAVMKTMHGEPLWPISRLQLGSARVSASASDGADVGAMQAELAFRAEVARQMASLTLQVRQLQRADRGLGAVLASDGASVGIGHRGIPQGSGLGAAAAPAAGALLAAPPSPTRSRGSSVGDGTVLPHGVSGFASGHAGTGSVGSAPTLPSGGAPGGFGAATS